VYVFSHVGLLNLAKDDEFSPLWMLGQISPSLVEVLYIIVLNKPSFGSTYLKIIDLLVIASIGIFSDKCICCTWYF
jgi:hypothetical protein